MPRSQGDNGCVNSLSKEVLSGASCGLADTKWTMMQPHHASTALSGNRRCCSSNNSSGSSSANSHSSCCWGVPHQALHMYTWAMPTACCTVLLVATSAVSLLSLSLQLLIVTWKLLGLVTVMVPDTALRGGLAMRLMVMFQVTVAVLPMNPVTLAGDTVLVTSQV